MIEHTIEIGILDIVCGCEGHSGDVGPIGTVVHCVVQSALHSESGCGIIVVYGSSVQCGIAIDAGLSTDAF
jgi:hypothetical protein